MSLAKLLGLLDVSLELVSFGERLRTLLAPEPPFLVVLVDLVLVKVKGRDEVHGADAAVKVADLVDPLHVVAQLLLVGKHSLAQVALLAEHHFLLEMQEYHLTSDF